MGFPISNHHVWLFQGEKQKSEKKNWREDVERMRKEKQNYENRDGKIEDNELYCLRWGAGENILER